MRKIVAIGLLVPALLTACSKKDKGEEGAGKPCGPAPTALITPSITFPAGEGVAYTSSKAEGPSTILEGFANADLAEVYDNYKTLLGSGGYSVTKSEKEEDDAEVNFSGNRTTGQVKLVTECEGRTSITITIRPS
jgi:hypothetical protein